ncbi:MAG: ABC transporter substrate-binding protein [Anaerolineales bacterium]|nr:ABC transporter substrate-binding protein [Anaerolineales bacterium]
MFAFKRYDKVVLCIIMGLLCVAVFSACSTGGNTAPTSEVEEQAEQVAPTDAPAVEEPAEQVTIEFWFHDFTPEVEYNQELIDLYQKEHPNVTINMSHITLMDYTQKLAVAMSTGTGPDLYDLGTWFLPHYSNNGLMDEVPLDQFGWNSLEEAKNDYLPGTLDGLIYDDKLYAIPIQMNSFSLYLNNRLFEEAGLSVEEDAPTTWEEVIEVAKKLQKVEGDVVTVSGFDFSFNGPLWHMFMFEPLIHQYGGEILTPDGKAAINSEAGVQALTLMKRIAVDEGIGDPEAVNASGAKDDFFRRGVLGMWQSGPWFPAQFQPDDQISKDGYTVVPLPNVKGGVDSTMFYGFVWAVNSSSDDAKKQAAWDFTKFAASRPTEWLERMGFFQPRVGWTDTPEAQAIPFVDVYVHDAARSRYLVMHENYNEISQAITRAVDKVLLAGEDPKTALDVAAEEINQAIGK